MKNIPPFLLVITLFISGLINAQNYMPIPNDSTSHWKIHGSQLLNQDCVRQYSNWHYIKGEKIVGGNTFYKIYSKGHWSDNAIPPYGNCSGSGETLDVYEGAIRTEDTIIYYIPTGQNYPEVLFDYTLEIGDTVPPTIYLNNVPTVTTIESIDSVITDSGEYLKRWYFENILFVEEHWFIEGIGTKKGIFYPFLDGGEHRREFKCYSEIFLPFYPAGYACDPTVSVFERETETIDFALFPNPSNGMIKLKIFDHQSNHFLCEIINLTGQSVFSQEVDDKESNTIDCTNIKPGLYFITVSSGKGKMITKKLVISH